MRAREAGRDGRETGDVPGEASRSATAASARTRHPPLASRLPLTIRPATLEDLSIVVELRIALLREHGGNPIYGRLRADAPERARRLFATQLASDDEVIFLGFLGDRAVGVLRCVQSAGSPLLRPAAYGYISSVYVDPEARRAGVLSAMFDRAVAWCRERGLAEIRLHSAADHPASNAAWDALGFGVVEHLRLLTLD